MTTKFIGLKELRQNMATVTREASKKRHRVIVLKKNRPLFELRPLSTDDTKLWTFHRELEQALEDSRKGRTYTTTEVRKMLGLKPYEI